MQILGAFGIANLLAGLFLLRRNHVVGWLTITPILAVCCPFVAIPFANAIARRPYGLGDINSFHRLFLAIPAGLALVAVADMLSARTGIAPSGESASSGSAHGPPAGGLSVGRRRSRNGRFVVLIASLLALATVPPSGPFFNRFWNAMESPPSDLSMSAASTAIQCYMESPGFRSGQRIAATAGISFVAGAQAPVSKLTQGRTFYNEHCVPADDIARIRDALASSASSANLVVAVPSPTVLYTAHSLAAQSSGHWLPEEVAFAYVGAEQLSAMARSHGFVPLNSNGAVTFLTAPGSRPVSEAPAR